MVSQLSGRIFVTGGAGFLARGLYRQAEIEQWPAQFTCYSRHEEAQDVIKHRFPHVQRIIGDVRDLDRLELAMIEHDVVIHAGALKRVDECEFFAHETVQTNILGSMNVIVAARSAGVKCVVGISTDKAVQPVNIYGMSKATMERLFSERYDETRFVCVRYGNVIGSTGSVIPLFAQQFAEFGKVKITDPTMSRFWMPVDQAVDAILTAIEEGPVGSVIIPRPIAAMRIVDVARAATVDDVEIEEIGARPGEKRHELLMHFEESVRATRHDGYYALHPAGGEVSGEPKTLSSVSPQVLMTPSEMREHIEDAKTI